MADVGVIYTLTSPGPGTVTFNEFTDPFIGQDQYYITEIRGLESADIRTPVDPVPLGDGALVHDFWFGSTHIGIEGLILVQSTTIMNDIVQIRNSMTNVLSVALAYILRNDGTLAFTPQGAAARSITVRYEVPLNVTHTDNYNSVQFSFGLIAGDPTQ